MGVQASVSWQRSFLLELPPYRLPGLRHMLIRATGEVRAFLELASSFILMGVVLVWLVSHIPAGEDKTLADMLGSVMAPVLDPIGIRTNWPLPCWWALWPRKSCSAVWLSFTACRNGPWRGLAAPSGLGFGHELSDFHADLRALSVYGGCHPARVQPRVYCAVGGMVGVTGLGHCFVFYQGVHLLR
jgi:hypothetical protein